MGNVFVVTCDGCVDVYASFIYLIGVFGSREKAENAVEHIKTKTNERLSNLIITEVTMDEIHDVNCDTIFNDYYHNELELGGYAE